MVATNSMLRRDAKVCFHQVSQDSAFKLFRALVNSSQGTLQLALPCSRISGVFDQSAPVVSGLEVGFVIEAMDYPHLIARAAGGNVESLFEDFLWTFLPHRQRGVGRGRVHYGQKHYVTLVALELRGV